MAEKINVNDLKNGSTFLHEGNVFLVLTTEHSKSGRGQAHVKIKAKNLMQVNTQMLTFTGGDKVEKAFVKKFKAQFIYEDESGFNFMNNETFEQIAIPTSKLEWEKNFIVEGQNVNLTSFEEQILGIELDTNVELEIQDTADAVKGNTVTNATKKATTNTSLELDVPQFIQIGDKIIVNTETGKYVSRA